MSSLVTHPRVATFIYSRSKVRDRKLLARAEALSFKLKRVDIETEKLTTTHFASLANAMDVDINSLIDSRIVQGHEISDTEGALKLINKNPELLKTPIVVTAECVTYIGDFGDLARLEKPLHASNQSLS